MLLCILYSDVIQQSFQYLFSYQSDFKMLRLDFINADIFQNVISDEMYHLRPEKLKSATYKIIVTYVLKRIVCLHSSFNPFPHIDAFWSLCSRQLFENIVTKEKIAQNV